MSNEIVLPNYEHCILNTITSIFNGINELYREATDDEVETFLSMDIINLESDFSKDQVKTANRRRIKEATERYNNFSTEQKNRIPNYMMLRQIDFVYPMKKN